MPDGEPKTFHVTRNAAGDRCCEECSGRVIEQIEEGPRPVVESRPVGSDKPPASQTYVHFAGKCENGHALDWVEMAPSE